ncbi:MAG TPA: hypothetical protein VIT45_12600 [Allosphingosinicella sp.]
MKPPVLAALFLTAMVAGCGTEDRSTGNSLGAKGSAEAALKPVKMKMDERLAPHAETMTPPVDAVRKTADPIPERVWDAFEAATGHRSNFGVTEGRNIVVTRPVKIVELPFGPALLTEVEIELGCHGCAGAIGVYYLKQVDGKFRVKRRWPRAIRGWTWGLPPTEWHLTNRFTSYPAIYARGGFLAQGISTATATITELRPAGPIESDLIGTNYDDEGDPQTGRQSCRVEGKIANIRKDRSFDLVVSGSVKTVARYVKRDGRFRTRSRIRWNDPCRD